MAAEVILQTHDYHKIVNDDLVDKDDCLRQLIVEGVDSWVFVVVETGSQGSYSPILA